MISLFTFQYNVKVYFTRLTYVSFFKRTMISSRCMYAARAMYHAALLISNTDTINKLNKTNLEPLVNEMVQYALDDNKGIIQQKTTIFKHLSNQKFHGELFYESFINQMKTTVVKYEPHVSVDVRTLNELKSLELYIKYFGKDVEWIYATLDNRSANFPYAQQTNPDFWVYINKLLGFKGTYQDDKSGMDMLKHSSKGSIGVLTYNEEGQNLQMTSNPITITDLISYNKTRLNKLLLVLQSQSINQELLDEARSIQNNMQGKSFEEVSNLHNDIQNILWRQI